MGAVPTSSVVIEGECRGLTRTGRDGHEGSCGGSNGGTGRATVAALVAEGHEVTALARSASSLTGPGVCGVDGDATDPAVVDRLVAGQDAVVVTLGISENTVRVRLRGPSRTPMDVRSRGTRLIIDAMRRHGVRRLVMLSSYGVGSTRSLLPLASKIVFALLIAPQIADTERQAAAVHTSGLEWVEAQPVYLTDGDDGSRTFASTRGEIRRMRVSREQVGRFLAQAVASDEFVGATVSLSTEAAA